MSIEIKNLEQVEIQTLVDTFNSAFLDYIIPFHLSEESLILKLRTEFIDLSLSVGVFDGDKLVSFMLTGLRKNGIQTIFYNGGTGVLPRYRGLKLVDRMYVYLYKILNVEYNHPLLLLEGIAENERAIRVYKRLGYAISRDLFCFKGCVDLNTSNEIQDIKIEDVCSIDWDVVRKFWDVQPSWQNSIDALNMLGEDLLYKEARVNGYVIGYICYHKNNGRIYQLAVHKTNRLKGIGSCLLRAVAITLSQPLIITNIDSSSVETIQFLEHAGLKRFIVQHEMIYQL